MKYMLLMYSNDDNAPQHETEAEQQAFQQEWYSYLQETKKAGVLVANNGLTPIADATTVRVRDGKTLTTDGPFAETHEQLGGYFILDCPDLDEAIKWAEKIPTAKFGSIEVRALYMQ